MSYTIQVRYSCERCGLRDVACQVPERGPEDVSDWVGQIVAYAIGRDHHRRQPECRATALSALKIPINGRNRVGECPGTLN